MSNKSEIPELNVGIVGHIDHGKTTLLSKLTGKFTDTHSEELKRGITIKLGYANMTIYKCGEKFTNKQEKNCIPFKHISFIDVPGHEMLMATMLSGAAIIDAAVLVIAANEGIKPQTKEHFMALQAKKISNIIIVQNKIDLVDKKRALENYSEIKSLIKGTVAENAPIIPVSTLQEINIDNLIEELSKFEPPEKDLKSQPIFLVARSFDVNKPGTEIKKLNGGVFGGVLKRGILKIGDEIEIKPGLSIKKGNQQTYQTIKTRIIALHKIDSSVNEISPGASISIETELDPILTKADSMAGCLISKRDFLPEITYKTKLKIKLFNEILGVNANLKVEPLKTKEMLMLSVNTTITVGTVERIKNDETELTLNIPIIAIKGDNVGIARNVGGHWRLIGWGEILA